MTLGNDLKIRPSDSFRKRIAGASEKDIVHSGLAQTMETAALNIMKTAHKHKLCLNLRLAAYMCSIEKIFLTYEEAGLAFWRQNDELLSRVGGIASGTSPLQLCGSTDYRNAQNLDGKRIREHAGEGYLVEVRILLHCKQNYFSV